MEMFCLKWLATFTAILLGFTTLEFIVHLIITALPKRKADRSVAGSR